MSDPRHEPDLPEGPPSGSGDDLLVESLLESLEPTPLDVGFLDRLERQRRSCARGAEGASAPPSPWLAGDPAKRPQPARLLLLSLASIGALAAYLAAHFDFASLASSPAGEGPPALAVGPEAPAVGRVSARATADAGGGPTGLAGAGDSILLSEPSFDGFPSPDRVADSPLPGFLPVSRQGILVDSSHQGVVETEGGARERLQLEFRDAWHWRDPESGTNLRLYLPRSETVEVPLRTD